jgi:inorganic pyrophosphatase
MKRMNKKAYKHNYPKNYGFLRHKSWKGDNNDAPRKEAKKEINKEIDNLDT